MPYAELDQRPALWGLRPDWLGAAMNPVQAATDIAARHVAAALLKAAPRKIEGGSAARRQWLADLTAVQVALYEIGGGEAFIREMRGADEPTSDGQRDWP